MTKRRAAMRPAEGGFRGFSGTLRLSTVWALALFLGCTHPEQLSRAESHYGNARYEAACVNLDDLEAHLHMAGMSREDRTRFYFARGMAYLHLEMRAEAHHWLALAREELRTEPTLLPRGTVENIDRALAESDTLSDGGVAAASADASAEASPASH